MTVAERVKDFVVANFYVSDPAEITLDYPLVGRGLVDSTGMLEVIAFLEEEYGIRIADHETVPENLGTIALIAAFVERKRAASAAA
jgi:acyl carrier protein